MFLKASNLSLIVAIAAVLQPAAATPPACLLACVAQVAKLSSCSALNDLSCICTSNGDKVNECLKSACPRDDASTAKSAFEKSCSGHSVSSASSASSTGASTTTPSSSSSTEFVSSTTTSPGPLHETSEKPVSSSITGSPSTTEASSKTTTSLSGASAVDSVSASVPHVLHANAANDQKLSAAAAFIGLLGAALL